MFVTKFLAVEFEALYTTVKQILWAEAQLPLYMGHVGHVN